MKIINYFNKGVELFSKAGIYLSMVIIFFMMISTVTDSLGRRFFNNPIAGVIELNEIFLVVVIFMSMAWTQITSEHIFVEIFVKWFPQRFQIGIVMMTSFLAFIIMLALTYQGSLSAWEAYISKDFREGAVNYLLWPGKTAVPVGAAILSAQLLKEIIAGFISLLALDENTKETLR